MATITQPQIEAFRQHLIRSEKAPATVQKYTRQIKQLASWLGDRTLLKENLLNWRETLRGQFSPATVNNYICALSAFLDHIGKPDEKIKCLTIQPRPFTDDQKELTADEYERLLQAAAQKQDSRLYHILLTLGQTGIRVSELQYITLEAVREGRTEICNKGKCRTILIARKLKKALLHYARQTGITAGRLFITRNGRPVDRSNIHHAMKALCQKANVDPGKVFPHNLRHLFARAFYKIAHNLAWLADLLGHRSIETTRLYLRTTVHAQARILNQLYRRQ